MYYTYLCKGGCECGFGGMQEGDKCECGKGVLVATKTYICNECEQHFLEGEGLVIDYRGSLCVVCNTKTDGKYGNIPVCFECYETGKLYKLFVTLRITNLEDTGLSTEYAKCNKCLKEEGIFKFLAHPFL
jgi:hypothetical protein